MSRAIEALRHIAHGETIDDVADSMRLSRSSVEKYLHKARKSLNARTIAHAVYLATRGGLLSLLVIVGMMGNQDMMRRAPRTVRVNRRESTELLS